MKKEELFNVEVAGKYISTDLLWDAPTMRMNWNLAKNQLHSNMEDAEKYMKAAMDFLGKFKKLIKKNKCSYDPMFVLASKLSQIEGWTCSITVFSKYSLDDAAEIMFDHFDMKFKKDTAELQTLIDKRKVEFYSLTIKEEERLNELNDTLNFGLDADFLKYKGTMLLDNCLKSASELLETLKKVNEEK